MDKLDKMTTYHCLVCNAPFEVKQGSKRRYCDKHWLQREKERGRRPHKR